MVLPIIRAYIILTNTTILVHDKVQSSTSVSKRLDTSFHRNINLSLDEINKIRDGLNHTVRFAKSILLPENSVKDTTIIPAVPYIKNYEPTSLEIADKFTSAKPVDYLVAGAEGLAWVVHLFFILSLKRGHNPRGPLVIRTLIFLLLVISSLLLRSHINNKPKDDVLPNLSLGFSISVVTFLILYTITLIPGNRSDHTGVSSRNVAVSLYKLLLHYYLLHCASIFFYLRFDIMIKSHKM